MYVVYFWYDHLLLRENGDAEKVERAIEKKDFDTFMRFKKKYGESYFPDYAYSYADEDDMDGTEIDIRIKENFDRIDSSEYECG